MPQAHHLPLKLPYGRGTHALWSREPNGHVVVFVHGFHGHPVSTWSEFSGLLPEELQCAGRDFVFYGYDGDHTRATVSALELHDFIRQLFAKPLDLINEGLPRSDARHESFKYKSITLVGHSLGAIVSRQALLFGYQNNASWAPLTKLVLFAPAHSGADILSLLFQISVLAPIMMILSMAQIFGRYQVLHDLRPGSQALQALFEQTERAIVAGHRTAVAKKVVIASRDTVVSPVPFSQDPPPVLATGRSHVDVCKPDADFSFPVDELLHVLIDD